MKVALLEVSHWHFPLYRDALIASDVDIVAVSDSNQAIRDREAAFFSARPYTSPAELIASEAMDFAFAFGRHIDQPAICGALIDRGVPFAMEKPGGTSAADAAWLRRSAEAKQLFVAVAFIQRLGPLTALLDRLEDGEGAAFTNANWRFIAGPPSRYRDIGCDWMLDPEVAGGGCLINLAGHFIDLGLRMLEGRPNLVSARTGNTLHGEAVEDYATLVMGDTGGRTVQIETGYAFPTHPKKREYSFSLTSPSHYVRARETGAMVVRPGTDPAEILDFPLDADLLYGIFVERCLTDVAVGRPPVATLSDLEAVMRVTDAAYTSARTGRAERV